MLEVGDARAAANLAERYLRAAGAENRMERSGGLELLAHARARIGEVQAAAARSDQDH